MQWGRGKPQQNATVYLKLNLSESQLGDNFNFDFTKTQFQNHLWIYNFRKSLHVCTSAQSKHISKDLFKSISFDYLVNT